MKELEKIKGSDYGLEETKAQEIKAVFIPMLDEMESLEKEYNAIVGKTVTPALSKKAGTLRKKYMKIRTGTDKIHKEAKAYYLAGSRFVDGLRNTVRFAAQGNEDKLYEIENHEEILSQAEIDQKRRDREWKLAEYGVEVFPPQLGEWEDEVWDMYVAGAKEKWKISQEKKLQEQKRIEAEEKAKDIEIQEKNKKIAELQARLVEPISVVDNTHTEELSDIDKSRFLREDLLTLRHKYTFQGYKYRFAYGKMVEKFEAMEDYLKKLEKQLVS